MKQEIKLANCFLFLFALILFFTSCRKGELPVPIPTINSKGSGPLTTKSVELSSTYENQIYFDFSSNSNKGKGHRDDWDLRFSCDPSNSYIQMNGAKMMMSSRLTGQTFESVNSTVSFNTNVAAEHPSGRMDSLAIKNGDLFLINRGSNAAAVQLGVIKMEIIEHNATHFKGRFANLDGSNEQTVTIPKNNDYNFVYLKWNTSAPISTPTIEPLKDTWDIVFAQYTESFYTPYFLPYSVVGCLTNAYNTLSLEVTNKAFEDIDLDYASNLVLSNDRNIIGYSWKTFLFDSDKYAIHSDKVYIIKDSEGDFYKLRFIDFYNMIGEKGTPMFEFQRL
jgi:hypothetical protein